MLIPASEPVRTLGRGRARVLQGRTVAILPGTPASQLTPPLTNWRKYQQSYTEIRGACKKEDQHPFHWLPIYLGSGLADFPCVLLSRGEKKWRERGQERKEEGASTQEAADTPSLERQG